MKKEKTKFFVVSFLVATRGWSARHPMVLIPLCECRIFLTQSYLLCQTDDMVIIDE